MSKFYECNLVISTSQGNDVVFHILPQEMIDLSKTHASIMNLMFLRTIPFLKKIAIMMD